MLYKIKDRNTGLFYNGDSWVPSSWTKIGKTYKQKGYVKKLPEIILRQYDYWLSNHGESRKFQRPEMSIITFDLRVIYEEKV